MINITNLVPATMKTKVVRVAMPKNGDKNENSLGPGNDEDKGGEGGDAEHHQDLVPQPTQLPQA